jgi:hypothetical protein
MKIMLDNSEKRILEREEKYDMTFWQLQTPLSRRKIIRPYGLDNGCFARFEENTWNRQVEEAERTEPKFVCLPDIVGDARRTLELFELFKTKTIGVHRALVLQDGIGNFNIPWNELSAVFVGGSDNFKIAPECINACKTAKILGKWVHVGRVNTSGRLQNWLDLGDSLDGSGISQYDKMLEDLLTLINAENKQGYLL